jgi:hypothetical protein
MLTMVILLLETFRRGGSHEPSYFFASRSFGKQSILADEGENYEIKFK